MKAKHLERSVNLSLISFMSSTGPKSRFPKCWCNLRSSVSGLKPKTPKTLLGAGSSLWEFLAYPLSFFGGVSDLLDDERLLLLLADLDGLRDLDLE